MASLTVENYVKTIFKICRQSGDRLATTGRLATALGVSPGTVTSMLKALSESGLAIYAPYEGVQLTASGTELALRILRRHRLIECFLAKVLDLGWDEVHDDAEQLEHAASDRLIQRIDEFLGFPRFDPHGDPIPTADGQLPERPLTSLAECSPGAVFELAQVVDQSPEFLRYLRGSGFSIGCQGKVIAKQPEAAIITVRLGDRELPLGIEAAQKMLVSMSVPVGEVHSHGVPTPHLGTLAGTPPTKSRTAPSAKS